MSLVRRGGIGQGSGSQEPPGLPEVTLLMNQGGLFLEDCWVGTVLGSCVAVTFHCRRTLLAGMFHAQLPLRVEDAGDNVWRFVDASIDEVLRRMLMRGADRRIMEAKVFGGASMRTGIYSVGDRNVETALEALRGHGVHVAARNVGGSLGRKIRFRTSTGEVLHKFLRPGQAMQQASSGADRR